MVFVKSSGWMVAFGGGFWRKEGGIVGEDIVMELMGKNVF